MGHARHPRCALRRVRPDLPRQAQRSARGGPTYWQLRPEVRPLPRTLSARSPTWESCWSGPDRAHEECSDPSERRLLRGAQPGIHGYRRASLPSGARSLRWRCHSPGRPGDALRPEHLGEWSVAGSCAGVQHQAEHRFLQPVPGERLRVSRNGSIMGAADLGRWRPLPFKNPQNY